jgi:toxin secretion/phage lysis holin
MKTVVNILQVILSAIGGFLGWFLGGLDGFMYALIAFVVIDYLTGIMVAIIEKNLSSAIGFRGIFRKVLIFVLVGVANLVDTHIIQIGCGMRTAVIFFYLSNEGISILENSTKLGLPIPQKLKDILKQVRSKK